MMRMDVKRRPSRQSAEFDPNVALAWALQQPGVTAVLAGARTPEQVTLNAEAAELTLSADVLNRLNEATKAVKQIMGPNADPWRTASRIR